MISEALHFLGVPGSIVVVVSAGLAVYHGRSLLAFGATMASWLRFAGIGALLAALVYSGLVPGVNLDVDFGSLGRFLGWVWSMVPVGLDDVVRWLPL